MPLSVKCWLDIEDIFSHLSSGTQLFDIWVSQCYLLALSVIPMMFVMIEVDWAVIGLLFVNKANKADLANFPCWCQCSRNCMAIGAATSGAQISIQYLRICLIPLPSVLSVNAAQPNGFILIPSDMPMIAVKIYFYKLLIVLTRVYQRRFLLHVSQVDYLLKCAHATPY